MSRSVDEGPKGPGRRTARPIALASERGGALLLTLLTAVLISGLTGALVVLLTTEEAVEANQRRAIQALYAAEGLLAVVVADLAAAPHWDAPLAGSWPSPFGPRTGSVRLADGAWVDLRVETQDAQRTVLEPDRARWRLHASGWLSDLLDRPDGTRLVFLAAWVADDPADPDDDPDVDGNGQILVRVVAFGPSRTRQAVEATARRHDGGVSLLTWDVTR